MYTTSVGNTKAFGDEGKRLIGLVGIFTGVGEIVGGAVFGFMGKVSRICGSIDYSITEKRCRTGRVIFINNSTINMLFVC